MLEDKIQSDFNEAMKNRNDIKKSTLSFLRSQLKNVAIDKKKDKLDDAEVIEVIKKQVKQRLESVEMFRAGGRLDLAEKEQKELEVLKNYLPKELAKDQLEKIVDEVIGQTNAVSLKDMGRVMKEVMLKVAGKADNKLLSELVRLRLTKDEGSTAEGK